MIENIQWLGHSSFMIQGSPIVHIAPWRVIKGAFHSDIILLGHDHYDHCSQADINKLCGPDTLILGNEMVRNTIPRTTVIRPWQSLSVDRMSIKAIPAYSPNDLRHPKSDNGLGFLISVNFFDIYYAGDTQIIPEMENIHPDIALLPIDGYGRLSVDEAIEVVDLLKPRWVIPYNWGSTGEEASALDAKDFQKRIGGRAEVVLLPVVK